MVRWAAVAALMLSMAAPAGADQRPPKNRHLLWLSLGRFSPVSATAREAFGESRPVLDIELFRPRTRRGPRLDLDLSTRALTRETQGFFFAGLTGGMQVGLADARRRLIPFGRVHAGPYFVRLVPPLTPTARLKPRPDGTFQVEAQTRFVPGMNGELGLEFKERLTLAARYDHLARVESYRLSGWTFSVGCRVL